MNKTEVLALLKANRIENGTGLTALRKLAKQVGRDHELAVKLWESKAYDARVIALLIDDPKKITREQAEAQVERLDQGHLEHVFSTCGAPLAKTPFAVELSDDWIKNKDPLRRSCGYGLLYELSKSKTKSAPDDAFFLEHIKHIRKSFDGEELAVQGSMGGALLGIGKRSAKLNAAALKVARYIGPIEFETDGPKCEPFDVVKHLTSDYIKKKLGV